MGSGQAKARTEEYFKDLDVSGKTYVVTGSNVGLGYQSAKTLYRAGARVVMACRSKEKAEAAIESIQKECTERKEGGSMVFVELDLMDLDNVKRCAEEVGRICSGKVDGLLNNAGVMMCPEGKTKQGFETQLGTNHYGHFVFTMAMLPLLESSDEASPRVVTVSSGIAKRGAIRWDDMNFSAAGSYNSVKAYGQSKLANLMFVLELDRRLKASTSKVVSIGAHPGVSHTDLARHFSATTLMVLNVLPITMPSAQGALSQTHALVAPDIPRGSYWGPDGIREVWGFPMQHTPVAHARNEDDNARLWEATEKATGASFPFDTPKL